jgi:hypothetical protein
MAYWFSVARFPAVPESIVSGSYQRGRQAFPVATTVDSDLTQANGGQVITNHEGKSGPLGSCTQQGYSR